MDLSGPNRFPNRKPTATERFLGIPPHAPPPVQNPTDELHEDDVVFFSDDYHAEPIHHNTSTPSSSSSSASATPNHNHHHLHNLHHHSFGILAALPENESSPNRRNASQLFPKATVSSISSSSSSPSSSRLIPTIPRAPSQDRITPNIKYHQSAPVNVPVLTEAMMKARRKHREFDDGEEEETEEEEEMLPPHEIVARNSQHSPMLAYSVLEGVGRTLKGRDLRQVRNAVWRQTGFAD